MMGFLDLIYASNYSWLLNLNLTYEALSIGAGSGLLISMLEKLKLILFHRSNNSDATDVKMYGSVLQEKSSFKILIISFSTTLDGDTILSLLLKLLPKN